MKRLAGPFSPDRDPADRAHEPRPTLGRGARRAAVAACAGLIAVSGWRIWRGFAVPRDSGWTMWMIVKSATVVVVLAGILAMLWELLAPRTAAARRRPGDAAQQAGPEPSATDAAAALDAMSRGTAPPTASENDTVDPALLAARRPAPDRPAPVPPKPELAERMVGTMCLVLAAIMCTMAVVLTCEALTGGGDETDGTPRWPEVVTAWLCAACATPLLAFGGWHAFTIRRRDWLIGQASQGQLCGKCGYDVRGAASDNCPECGTWIRGRIRPR